MFLICVGQKFVGFHGHSMQHGTEGSAEALEALGCMVDLLSIKGHRAYVDFLNAPVIERLLQQVPASLYTFLKESAEIADGSAGGKARAQVRQLALSPCSTLLLTYDDALRADHCRR